MKKPICVEHMYRLLDSLTDWERRCCFYLCGEFAEQYHEVKHDTLDDGEGYTLVSVVTGYEEAELFVLLLRQRCPKVNYWFGTVLTKLPKREPQG